MDMCTAKLNKMFKLPSKHKSFSFAPTNNTQHTPLLTSHVKPTKNSKMRSWLLHYPRRPEKNSM